VRLGQPLELRPGQPLELYSTCMIMIDPCPLENLGRLIFNTVGYFFKFVKDLKLSDENI